MRIRVNGETFDAAVHPGTLLVDWLRDGLGLTGTHVGCTTSQCGACHVMVDGEVVKSCTILVGQCDGADVTTIEGLGTPEALHPMQEAFRTAHGLQCGFCTPGMVMAGIAIARTHGAHVSDETIRHELEGNLCRCTGYQNIVAAIRLGARAMAEAGLIPAAENA
ncbi:MAG: (2Fe-2S)-binding protein [Sphingomonadaceae bacterium]|uniref:(2Fe-2S)-binding protein n=1 Tax=Thermaurantiacus sp. TaxID=2820283 RepID=UPI00298EFA88|nr:(2Fe-2S)-binding protein [Thermaurantiacus sp.]MCS6986326.1 (2Fe-2S)-binding protein [Sphingomonadaceae bacterium]MDW8414412.1 (2Fe-2S)-binding protein [Thermaurantiacus sp.]